jgi:hypothetical protein
VPPKKKLNNFSHILLGLIEIPDEETQFIDY